MSLPDYVNAITAALGADPAQRVPAEQFLQQKASENLAHHLAMILTVAQSETVDKSVRKLATLVIKVQLKGQSDEVQAQKAEQWYSLDTESKNGLKNGVLQLLSSPVEDAREGAAQVIAIIGLLELEKQNWPEIIPTLVSYATNADASPAAIGCKVSSLSCIGFLCEELDPALVTQDTTNSILTALIDGMGAEKPDEVKKSAVSALLNTLQFVAHNMNNEVERNIIMTKICEGTQSPNLHLRSGSYECIVRVASLYYEHLQPYMQKLFELTFITAKNDEQIVAVQAIEFWSTVCEEELACLEHCGDDGVPLCKSYVEAVLQYLVPLLLECMAKQEEDQDDDTDLNVSMASAGCMELVAQVTGDKVVDYVMPFVTGNIKHDDWHMREAAVMAFGSILEGPGLAKLQQFLMPSLPVLLTALTSDASALMRDTSAWTVSRIIDACEGDMLSPSLAMLVQGLAKALEDEEPRVATNACYSIHNLAKVDFGGDGTTSALSSSTQFLMEKLVLAADREDWREKNLRVTAYEAMNSLAESCADDQIQLLINMLGPMLQRLQNIVTGAATSSNEKESNDALQANICSLLQVIAQRLDTDVKPYATNIMTCLLGVLNVRNALAAGEAMMAVGAIANALEDEFEIYAAALMPFIYTAMQNHEEYEVCAVAVGLAGDVCRAIRSKMAPFCNNIMGLLLQMLQSEQLHRSVKPAVLSVFGDVAMALDGEFEPYLQAAMTMLQGACQQRAEEDEQDEDFLEYINQLRESALEAYTGIFSGMSEGQKASMMVPGLPALAEFLQLLAADIYREPAVTKSACGLVGDVAVALGSTAAVVLKTDFVHKLLTEAKNDDELDVSDKETVFWAAQQVSKI